VLKFQVFISLLIVLKLVGNTFLCNKFSDFQGTYAICKTRRWYETEQLILLLFYGIGLDSFVDNVLHCCRLVLVLYVYLSDHTWKVPCICCP